MEENKTILFNIEEIENQHTKEVLIEVYNSLTEKGYNAINQIVGYLISADPGYISSYNNSRTKILELDRTKILEVLVKDFIGEK